MSKDKLTDYSATAASNTDIGGVNIDEGMLPSNVNNALREQMSHLADFAAGTTGVDVLNLQDDDASHSIKIQAPATVTATTTLTLPDGDGDANQVLTTDGSGTLSWGDSVQSFTLYEYTATADQTTFTGSDDNAATLTYTAGSIIVFMNGVALDPSDYTATNGTSLVLSSGAALNDIVNIIAFGAFTVADTVSASAGGTFNANVTVDGTVTSDGLTVDTNTLYVDSTNNRVGIGTDSPTASLMVNGGVANFPIVVNSTDQYAGVAFADNTTTSNAHVAVYADGNNLGFEAGNAERMRIDSSGNLLVGKNAASTATVGAELRPTGQAILVADGTNPILMNRQTSDGDIAVFRKDGTTVGSIGSRLGGNIYLDAPSAVYFGTNLRPLDDNSYDVGASSLRWDDIYATNGSIQTSDENEKQQIASLTDAEMTAAKAISALFKTYKWNDSVAEKGDAARTHTGVIAQDVQSALTDAGLDAGDYAFFISSTWWETQTDVPAVEAVDAVLDEDGNVVTEAVEAKEAYTRTDTYDTAEEAPEGATERTRLGVRYPELLAFVGAATEQRLANIETRIAALENV